MFKKKKLILLCLCVGSLSLIACGKEETPEETETTIEETTVKEIELPKNIETKKDTEGNDIYINLDPIPEEKLDAEGAIQEISESEATAAIANNQFSIYNLVDNQKAFDYTVPEGYELLEVGNDTFVIREVESGIPFRITLKDGSSQTIKEIYTAEFKDMSDYINFYRWDSEKEETLLDIKCNLSRSIYILDLDGQTRTYTTYCFGNYLGNTIEIMVASDDYLNLDGLSLEEYKDSEPYKEVCKYLEKSMPYYERILSGVSYE